MQIYMSFYKAALLILFAISSLYSEEIRYEIYRINSDKSRTLIKKGSKSYSSSDFIMRTRILNGHFYGVKKELELSNGFAIGLTDTYEYPLKGFGLWIDRIESSHNGFSWEWFDRVSKGKFIKRQGGMPIDVYTRYPSLKQEELSKILFKADIAMDYIENICSDRNNNRRVHYLIIIKAGSVLKLPQVAPTL